MASSYDSNGPSTDKIKFKRNLNTFGAISVIVGSIIGSGIYISPRGIVTYTGSVGLNLIVWVLCGLVVTGGGSCFAELATLMRESGGQWAYIRSGLGSAPAFIMAWTSLILTVLSDVVISSSCAKYLLSNFYGLCGIPITVQRFSGLIVLWLVVVINSNVKRAARLLKFLFVMKVLSLLFIITGGVYWMSTFGVSKLENAFEGTTDKPLQVAISFYSGLWAYDGWDVANYITEEVKDVKTTMPRAIITSMTLVICLYVMVNVSYYSVLTPQQVIDSTAVAVDWGRIVFGSWTSLFSVVVSLSIFGSSLASMFGTSRVLMAVAREGHTLEIFSMVSIGGNAPIIALCLRGILSTIIAFLGDIETLINLFVFSSWLFYGMSFLSLIVLKLKKYRIDDQTVFRVPLALPCIMLLIAIYLVVMPVASDPKIAYLYVVVFMSGGLLFYLPFVYCKVKLHWFSKVAMFIQLLFKVSVPDKELDES